jgi:peptide/nickel transport system permease protein
VPALKFAIRRLLAIPVTLFVITAVLYGVTMLAPAETRAQLYLPKGNSNNPGLQPTAMLQQIAEEHGLNDPYPVQYARWAARVLRGDWGWSPALRDDVLHGLLVRTPATAELTLFSLLLFVPLGIVSGVAAGYRENRRSDFAFRAAAFVATSIPPFILALVLLSIFYAGLRWFPPGRMSISDGFIVNDPSFKSYTGLLTIDAVLNSRPEIAVSALQHLLLPALTLSLAHWATLARVARVTIIEELDKDYVTAAHGRGLSRRSVIWVHALRNTLVPVLGSASLSIAALITGVFVVEAVFGFAGVSEMFVASTRYIPDTPMAMGCAVYSVLLVLPIMLVFDVIQAIIDPRIREGEAKL